MAGTSAATLDHLPSFSERQGGLFFQEDPNRYELRLFPEGYAEPQRPGVPRVRGRRRTGR